MTSPGSQSRITFMITKSEVGGAQRWVRDQMALLERDAQCHLVCGSAGWLTEQAPAKSVYVEPGLLRRLPFFTTLLRLKRHMKLHGVDTLVANSANAGVQARVLKLLIPELRVVYVSHGWSSVYNGGWLAPFYTFIERQLARFTDLVLCVSASDHQIAVQRIGIPEHRCVTILNAVFPPRKIGPPEAHPPWRLLFVGRLAHPKRPDLLIGALAHLKDIDVRLSVIGDGPKRAMIEYAPDETVEWLGEIPGFDLYADWHLFCLISDSEGLPMSALEARAAGCPLLLSDVGGCGELIDGNGRTTGNSPEQIADNIRGILKDYSTYRDKAMSLASSGNLAQHRDRYLAIYRGDLTGEKS